MSAAAHPLDNPLWQSLTTQHAAMALRAGQAARYPAEVAPFAAVAGPTADAAQELATLAAPGEHLYLLGVAPPLADGWRVAPIVRLPQMACDRPLREVDGPEVTEMGEDRREDMVALTTLVFPGFFRRRTLEMGRYIGIYRDGRLAAMAGERMRLDGFQEISAVCTHPDYLGRGYATQLMAILCNAALARGMTPFLHVYADNTRAIGLYRHVGFRERIMISLWAVDRSG